MYSTEKVPEKINWARIKYTAVTIGLSTVELMRLNPIEFYEMVDFYNKMERKKYGK